MLTRERGALGLLNLMGRSPGNYRAPGVQTPCLKKKKVLVTQSFPTFCEPMDCSPPLSIEFYRQEYWSGLPFPSPGDVPDPGIEPGSPSLQVDSLPSGFPDW